MACFDKCWIVCAYRLFAFAFLMAQIDQLFYSDKLMYNWCIRSFLDDLHSVNTLFQQPCQ